MAKTHSNRAAPTEKYQVNSSSKQPKKGHGKAKHPTRRPSRKQKPKPKNKQWGYLSIMARRIVPFAIPIIVLTSFAAILNLTTFLKGPRGSEDNILQHLELAQNSIVAEDWAQALTHIENARKAWAIVIPRIQMGVAKDDIVNLTLSLVRLKASTEAMDKPGCMRELAESFLYWDEIGK